MFHLSNGGEERDDCMLLGTRNDTEKRLLDCMAFRIYSRHFMTGFGRQHSRLRPVGDFKKYGTKIDLTCGFRVCMLLVRDSVWDIF